jgi:hypothetical protein
MFVVGSHLRLREYERVRVGERECDLLGSVAHVVVRNGNLRYSFLTRGPHLILWKYELSAPF